MMSSPAKAIRIADWSWVDGTLSRTLGGEAHVFLKNSNAIGHLLPNKRASKIDVNVSQSYCRICERMVVGF